MQSKRLHRPGGSGNAGREHHNDATNRSNRGHHGSGAALARQIFGSAANRPGGACVKLTGLPNGNLLGQLWFDVKRKGVATEYDNPDADGNWVFELRDRGVATHTINCA